MIVAGAVYFAAVFVVAFALGTVRTLWLAPAIGTTAAVLTELPLPLLTSFYVGRAIVRRWPAMTRREAIGTGAIAFALLMSAELLLAVAAFGMTAVDWLGSLVRMPGPIGLAGQLGFALMPLIAREMSWRRSSPPRQP
ncbi:MAG: hypothetical protein K2P79_13595 [Sphingomonas sp.]|nr:hypothetical protein [Sphingomonas sp.]